MKIECVPDAAANSAGAAITSSGLARLARRWGYQGRIELPGALREPLLYGRVERFDLPEGGWLCASDISVLREHDSTADLAPGLTVQLTVQGSLPAWDGGSDAPVPAVAAVSDGSLRTYVHRRRGERQRLLVLQLDAGRMADPILAERLGRLLVRPTVVPLQAGLRLSGLVEELLMPGLDPLWQRLLAESCAAELLVRALQALERPACIAPPPAVRVGLERARAHLTAEPGAEHSLAALARLAGMSASTLKQRFAQTYGCSVFEFLRSQRLEQARLGLRQCGWSVKQAALHCGYRHPANFATAYRRRFGCPPSRDGKNGPCQVPDVGELEDEGLYGEVT